MNKIRCLALLLPPLLWSPSQSTFASEAHDWSGFHAGLHGGYGSGQARTTMTGSASYANPESDEANVVAAAMANAIPTSLDTTPAGYAGGLSLGYNWRLASLVYGLEADLWMADISKSGNATGSSPISGFPFNSLSSNLHLQSRIDNLKMLRARLGHGHHDWLLFASAGLVSGEVRSRLTATESIQGEIGNISSTLSGSTSAQSERLGWTAGFGLEYALSEKWSLRAEYLYYNLGRSRTRTSFTSYQTSNNNAPYASATADLRTTWDGNLVSLGVNYRF
ncbi:MAG: outer membrane beta-barrel protein [Azonexus sp.]